MKFEEALPHLKNGLRMQRSGWNGKNMYVEAMYPDERGIMTLPYFYLKTADDEQVPWVISHPDAWAEDWQFYKGPVVE